LDHPSLSEFGEALAAEGWKLSSRQVEQLHIHWELLIRWNQRLNLTRIIDWREGLTRHFGESLAVAALIEARSRGFGRVVDVGSGGGFPGVPLAVLLPQCEVVLIEAHHRKAAFLAEVQRAADLRLLRVVCARAEKMVERFDWLVSRAVEPREILGMMPEIAEWGALLVGRQDAEALAIPGAEWRPVAGKERGVLVFHVKPERTGST
jgi:16S rRNA (guanine527-N7)-methyltransferase